jgi:hypothetical protein
MARGKLRAQTLDRRAAIGRMERVKIVGTIAASCLRRIWSGRPGRKAGYVRYERSQPCHMRFLFLIAAWRRRPRRCVT